MKKVKRSYLGQNVTSSMIGGKMMASVDDDTAPTREMKSPMLGMAAARITESKWNSNTLQFLQIIRGWKKYNHFFTPIYLSK